MNRPIVIGTLLFFVLFGALLYFISHRAPEKRASGQSSTAPAGKSEERQIHVKLFFCDQDSLRLASEDRAVSYRDSLHAQTREVLNALIAGPKGNLIGTIPKGTKLLEVFVGQDGIAYVDFSGELVTGHQGGSTGEINTVYSIVNTLTFNLPQIKKVQILVDDHSMDTLKGHVDLSRPLGQDLSTTREEKKLSGSYTRGKYHEV